MFRNTHQVNAATKIILIQCMELLALEIKDVPESQLKH
jgi:hypothetical protein